MSKQAVQGYIQTVYPLYQVANRVKKSKLLDHAVSATTLDRKHLIKTFNNEIIAKNGRKPGSGRPPIYNYELIEPHLEAIYIAMERISGRRMKAALPEWLSYYKLEHPELSTSLQVQILKMSHSTLERFLRKFRAEYKVNKGLSSTSPARHMKNKVPINTLDYKVEKPGHFQADTVAHCGDTLAGAFINTVTLTDIFSAWTINHAIYKKHGHAVRKAFSAIIPIVPFDILQINTDSGSEFLNTPMLNLMGAGYNNKKIHFSRSRPYHKNDNCYVEQKNFTHVRELFGYERFEDEELVQFMNEIYEKYWNPYFNFFIPTFKLLKKERIGAKIVKKYGKPETPYSRLMASPHLTEEQKKTLCEAKSKLNPFDLKRNFENKLKEFFDELRKANIRKVA